MGEKVLSKFCGDKYLTPVFIFYGLTGNGIKTFISLIRRFWKDFRSAGGGGGGILGDSS